MDTADFLGMFVGGLAFIFVLGVVISIAVYVLTAVGVSKVLKYYNYDNVWQAWLPFFNFYALATCSMQGYDKWKIFGIDIPKPVFQFWWLIQIVVSMIPVVGGIAGFVFAVLASGTIYAKIYSDLEDKPFEDTKVLGYVSSVIGIIPIIKFLQVKA